MMVYDHAAIMNIIIYFAYYCLAHCTVHTKNRRGFISGITACRLYTLCTYWKRRVRLVRIQSRKTFPVNITMSYDVHSSSSQKDPSGHCQYTEGGSDGNALCLRCPAVPCDRAMTPRYGAFHRLSHKVARYDNMMFPN